MTSQSTIDKPLSEHEYAQLGEWLIDVSPLDLDGVLGLCHAITVAPSVLPPGVWLPVVLPNPAEALDTERMEALIFLLLRLYNEVNRSLQAGPALLPEADDIAACESFAAGYCAGAALDPVWKDNAALWSFAEPFAYLCGRLDWVAGETAQQLERDLAPEPRRALCERLGSMIREADDAFIDERAALLEEDPAPAPQRSKPKLGRNERCPCGSGKKYKHCCLRDTGNATNEPR